MSVKHRVQQGFKSLGKLNGYKNEVKQKTKKNNAEYAFFLRFNKTDSEFYINAEHPVDKAATPHCLKQKL